MRKFKRWVLLGAIGVVGAAISFASIAANTWLYLAAARLLGANI